MWRSRLCPCGLNETAFLVKNAIFRIFGRGIQFGTFHRFLGLGNMFSASQFPARLLVCGIFAYCVITVAQTSLPIANSGPQNPGSGKLVFKSTVRRVIVDVVVTDSLGKPVSGLTASDFAVSEDGKAQAIRSFDVHDFDPVSESLPQLPAELPANTFVNVPRGPERGPLYVLLLDLLNIERDDQPYARKQLLEFVRKKPLGTRFAVFVLSDRLYQVQGFTEDRNLLSQVLDPANPHSRIPKIFLLADNYRPYVSTPAVLAHIGEYLADLPGHKNLIWISDSFPSGIMPTSGSSVEALSISDQIKEATDTLARARIAVYPIDARGTAVTSISASESGGSPNPDAVANADSQLNAAYMTEEEIASATGGRAFHSTNDLIEALTDATEIGGRYYTLTYSPSNPNYDGRLRHIRVQVAKRGYRLEYRRTYFGSSESMKKETPREKGLTAELQPLDMTGPADSLYPNMQHGAPIAHQLLFRAYFHTLSPAAKATREQIAKLAESVDGRKKESAGKGLRNLKLQTYQIDYTIAARYPLLEIAAAAYDEEGKILNAAVQRVIEEGNVFPESKEGGAIYRVQQKFDVPVNASTVRVAVRDVATDNVGALEVKLPLAPEGANTSTPEAPGDPPSTSPK
jgi:VWFA-related protein